MKRDYNGYPIKEEINIEELLSTENKQEELLKAMLTFFRELKEVKFVKTDFALEESVNNLITKLEENLTDS